MPPITPELAEEFDAYADADGWPIGESDTYLISMVSSVEASIAAPVRQPLHSESMLQAPLSRRALLLSGRS
jgi:hypothetical protein